MLNNLKELKLEQVCKRIYRYPSFYGMNKFSEGIPVVRGEHLLNSGRISSDWDDYWFVTEEYANKYPNTRLELYDVVMSVRGTVGQFAMVGPEHIGAQISPNTIRISPDPNKICPKFLYYALKSDIAISFLAGCVSSSAVPALRATDIKLTPIILPSITEQRAITSILGDLDDKIELNRQINTTLETMAQATFKNWFIDFEPFRGQGIQDSPLGPIPVGWNVRKISQAIEMNPPRRLERGIDTAYVDMASLPTSSARVTNVATRAYTGSGSRFQQGDTLFARITPCLENGKTAIVDFLKDEEVGWGSTEFIVLGPKQPIGMYYIYCLARNPEFRNHAIQAMTGTSGRQRVDSKCFDFYYLAIPPSEVIQKFQDVVSPWFKMLKTNDEESQNLVEIRDTLLPKLLTGEVRVKNAKEFEEEVV